MSRRLDNKTCLVMGGGSSHAEGGLSNGQAVALTFAREGARLAVADLKLEAAEQTVAMMMSDSGRSELLPLRGMSAKSDPDNTSPVTTSSSSANASIIRSRNQPSDAMR